MRHRSSRGVKGAFFSLRAQWMLILMVFSLSCVAPFRCKGQDRNANPEPQKKAAADFGDWPNIRLYGEFSKRASVMKGTTEPVGNVLASQVVVLEDGVEQPGVKVSPEDGGASICLLIDQSSSIREMGKQIVAAAKELVLRSNPASDFCVVTFDAGVSVLQDFTQDRERIDAALSQVSFGGASALFDGVAVAFDKLRSRPVNRRRVLVIFSDGDDNYSRSDLGSLQKRLRYPGSPEVYSICLPTKSREGGDNLEGLSRSAGGRTYCLERAGELSDAGSGVAQLIRNRYLVAYASTHQIRDGKRHKIEIRLADSLNASKVKPYFRQEYYAPAQ